MREVIPGLLWVGNAFNACNVKDVLEREIAAVIDLAIEEPPITVLPRELTYCRFPIIDGQGNSPVIIEAAVSTTVRFVTGNVPTLISCSGGMSRSPAIAAAVVAQIESIEPEEAMKRIAASGPHDVAPRLWSEVIAALRSLR